jgi:hypothetical protein
MTSAGPKSVRQRSTATPDSAHPIKIGAAAVVLALSSSGMAYIEGCGIVEAAEQDAHLYRIRFVGERTNRTRFINPDWQVDPQRSCALLAEFLRWSASPQFEDFFPASKPKERFAP